MTEVLIVTGGSRGIGAAICARAAGQGYKVGVNYASAKDRADEVVRAISDADGEALAVGADIADPAAVAAMFEAVETALGPITHLINNAGTDTGPMPIGELDVEATQRVIDVNVNGYLYCCHEAVRRMSSARGGQGGVIVNISSRVTQHGGFAGDVVYTASKGAVDALTKGLAKEVAQEGIRVAGIRPGLILTEIFDSMGGPEMVKELAKTAVPVGRPGDPDEIATAALWLCSDEASYVTGAMLDVSGGR